MLPATRIFSIPRKYTVCFLGSLGCATRLILGGSGVRRYLCLVTPACMELSEKCGSTHLELNFNVIASQKATLRPLSSLITAICTSPDFAAGFYKPISSRILNPVAAMDMFKGFGKSITYVLPPQCFAQKRTAQVQGEEPKILMKVTMR